MTAFELLSVLDLDLNCGWNNTLLKIAVLAIIVARWMRFARGVGWRYYRNRYTHLIVRIHFLWSACRIILTAIRCLNFLVMLGEVLDHR